MAGLVVVVVVAVLYVGFRSGRSVQRAVGARGALKTTKALVPTMRRNYYRALPRAIGWAVMLLGVLAVSAVVLASGGQPKGGGVPAQAPTVAVVDRPRVTASPHWPHFDPKRTAPPLTRWKP